MSLFANFWSKVRSAIRGSQIEKTENSLRFQNCHKKASAKKFNKSPHILKDEDKLRRRHFATGRAISIYQFSSPFQFARTLLAHPMM